MANIPHRSLFYWRDIDVANDSPHLLPLIEQVAEHHPHLVVRSKELSADKGYDSTNNNRDLFVDYGITPVIDKRKMWKDGEQTCALFADRMDGFTCDFRTSVERVNSRLTGGTDDTRFDTKYPPHPALPLRGGRVFSCRNIEKCHSSDCSHSFSVDSSCRDWSTAALFWRKIIGGVLNDRIQQNIGPFGQIIVDS